LEFGAEGVSNAATVMRVTFGGLMAS
jgi:hypothetical protein